MRNFRLPALVLLLAIAASCGPKTVIKGHVDGAEGGVFTARHFGAGSYSRIDTLKLSPKGDFRYSTEIGESGPEFLYFFLGDKKIASLLVQDGDRIEVSADTLGNYEVAGSEESSRLREVEMQYSLFLNALDSAQTLQSYQREYVRYYRKCVRYVMDNSSSLTVVPVIFQKFSANLPVFSQPADVLVFRMAYENLSKVYPQSQYLSLVKAEIDARENESKIKAMMSKEAVGFPDLTMPDYNGEMKSLSGINAKAILLYFWDAGSYSNKEFVQSTLKPLYGKFSPKGLEIYSVCVTEDKAKWASVVKAQELSWINVNDGLGRQSSALRLYNVTKLPECVLISGGEIKAKIPVNARKLEEELTSCLQ